MRDHELNRNAFRAQTFAEASDQRVYYQNMSWKERLEIAAYLNSVAYNYDLNDPPRLERTLFSATSFLNPNEGKSQQP